MNVSLDQNTERGGIFPQYSDVICIEYGALERGSKHLIINHPGTDLFIDILHSFQGFFDKLPHDRQLILCGCIVDSLASCTQSSPTRFFSLSRSNEWTRVSSAEAAETTYSAFKYGLSNDNSLSLEYQIDITVRSVRSPCSQTPAVNSRTPNQASNSIWDATTTIQQQSNSQNECGLHHQTAAAADEISKLKNNKISQITYPEDLEGDAEVFRSFFFQTTNSSKEKLLAPLPVVDNKDPKDDVFDFF